MLEEVPVTHWSFSYEQKVENIRTRATIGVFPTFQEKASTMAMQKQAMVVVKRAINFINPAKVPVIVGECTLYV